MVRSPSSSGTMRVRRSSPNFWRRAVSSSPMSARRLAGLASRAFRYLISLASSSASSRSLPVSSAVSRRSGMSRMWVAWISLSSNRSMRARRAVSVSGEERMICTTSSMLSRAMSRPATMCARASALARRKRVRRSTTSIWWSR